MKVSKIAGFLLVLAFVMGAIPGIQTAQAQSPTELFFSEYIEGSSNNKALEIYNGTGTTINLGTNGYNIQMYFNGSATVGLTIDLVGTVANGDVFIIAQSSANATILAQADQTNGAGWFNGDDAVVLRKGTSVVDVIGQIGFDPGSQWGTDLTSTADNTLLRKAEICGGDLDGTTAFDPVVEWGGYALDTFGGLGAHTTNCSLADLAPEVQGTYPTNGAADFPVDANLSLTFSEPVNTIDPWFELTCSTSGSIIASVSGGPTTFALDPALTLVNGESCTLTILAANITDQDGVDPPDNMVMDFTVAFLPFDVCTQTHTPIYQIQGSGLAIPTPGIVTTMGVVVGDFEGSASQQGFYLQDPTGDGDATTSDGIFVFTGSANLVNAGQMVRVTGYARERFNQTTINGANSNSSPVPAANIIQCGTGSVLPADVTLPVSSLNDFEPYEGMLVHFAQELVIAEYFNYDRFGEIVLALPLDGEPRPFTGTANDEPGDPANARTLANSLRRITLDDANSAQNPSVLRHPNGAPFSLTNRFRGGDIVQGAVGVLGFDFSLYRIIPTGPATYIEWNPRPGIPEPIGGTIRVAAINTLNFFVTPDYPTGNPLDNTCGPLNNVECRGWDSDQAYEFDRQRDKLLTALSGMDADIIGLNELENTTGVEPLASIVSGLPGYAYIDTGTIGTDAIKVGLIYRSATVAPVGDFKLLTTAVDPRFLDSKNRPTLAQTFEVIDTGARFTVAVNHLKSKGSDCIDVGDPDLGDGQGNCSQTRRAAAEALVDWLVTDPTGSGDPDFLIIGDLNSYAQEDTIDEIKAGADNTNGTVDDFFNLIQYYQGDYAYSYTFDGQAGYLDHALANGGMLSQITGATEWHINSDEPDVLDYDTTFKPPAQDALYEVNPYRTSDHDPVIVGINPINYPPQVGPITLTPDVVAVGQPVSVSAPFTDPDAWDSHTATWNWGDGNTIAGIVTEAPGSGWVDGSYVYATPGIYTVQLSVYDSFGNLGESFYQYVVVFNPNGGFVTAGGWIESLPGAYQADPSLTGKANFGIVAKYKKGNSLPGGNVKFQLAEAGLNFKASSFEWLVVIDQSSATLKGTGTINEEGEYQFMIWTIDGSPDTLRMKIWQEVDGVEFVVYDNGFDQEIQGNIVIHK